MLRARTVSASRVTRRALGGGPPRGRRPPSGGKRRRRERPEAPAAVFSGVAEKEGEEGMADRFLEMFSEVDTRGPTLRPDPKDGPDMLAASMFPAEVMDRLAKGQDEDFDDFLSSQEDDFARFLEGLSPEERAELERDMGGEERPEGADGAGGEGLGAELEAQLEAELAEVVRRHAEEEGTDPEAAAAEAGLGPGAGVDPLEGLDEADMAALYREVLEPGSTGRQFPDGALEMMRGELGAVTSLLGREQGGVAPSFEELEDMPAGLDEVERAMDEGGAADAPAAQAARDAWRGRAAPADAEDLDAMLEAFEEAESTQRGASALTAEQRAAKREALLGLMRDLGVEADLGPGAADDPEVVEYTEAELRELEAEEAAEEAAAAAAAAAAAPKRRRPARGAPDAEAERAAGVAGVREVSRAVKASEWKSEELYKMATVDRGDDALPEGLSRAVNEVMRDLRYDLNQQETYLERHYHMWYLANRAAPSAAILRRVLREVRQRVPDFSPASALDVSAKTGSGLWAAAEAWRDDPAALRRLVAHEPDAAMADLGRRVAADVRPAPEWVAQTDPRAAGRHPLVMSTYTLQALTPERRREVLTQMWQATTDVLVLVESGTIEGFAAVREARDYLLSKYPPHPHDEHGELDPSRRRADGATVLAPCSNQGACPMGDPRLKRSCWFGQRIPRRTLPSRTPLAKVRTGGRVGGDTVVDYFSYVVLQKGSRTARPLDAEAADPAAAASFTAAEQAHRWARVLRPVRHVKRQAFLDLCTPDGRLERRIVTPSYKTVDPTAYRQARKAAWGDLWRFPPRPRSHKTLVRRLNKLLRRAEQDPMLLEVDPDFAQQIADLQAEVARADEALGAARR